MENDHMKDARPKLYKFLVGGLGTFVTGSCLIWTVVLIPLAIPMMIIGGLMALVTPFISVEEMTCPNCELQNTVEPQVKVFSCQHCEAKLKRQETDGWKVITPTGST